MSVKEFAQSLSSPILIYSALAVYGIVIAVALAYVHARFSGTARLLRSLQRDWVSAESSHKDMLAQTREHVSKLATPAAPVVAGPRSGLSFDTRNQVLAMGKKGFVAGDIARSCGLSEGDVDVLLGLARIQR